VIEGAAVFGDITMQLSTLALLLHLAALWLGAVDAVCSKDADILSAGYTASGASNTSYILGQRSK
jgi:hypothetical protein